MVDSWQDISGLMWSAAATLVGEEMLAAGSFSLQEAMSALELMEPRMDPEPEPVASTATLLALGLVRVSPSIPVEGATRAAWKLMEREMAWQQGATLSASVLDCCFAQPEGLSALKHASDSGVGLGWFACVLLALRLVELSRMAVELADVFEEEDYGDTPGGKLVDETSASLFALADRACSGPLGGQVRWRLALCHAVAKMIDGGYEGAEVEADCSESEAALTDLAAPEEGASCEWLAFLSERKGPVALRQSARDDALELVRGVRRAAELRRLFDTGCGELCRRAVDEPVQAARQHRALHRTLRATEAVQTRGSTRYVLPRSLAAVELGAEARRAALAGRIAAHCVALGRGPRAVSVLDVVDDAARSDGAPVVVAQQSEALDFFAVVACPHVLELLRSLCFNRCRVHAKLRAHVVQQWAQVVAAADEADARLAKRLGVPTSQRYLTNFAVRVAFYLMTLNLELNVELQLTVSPTELETLFFYRDYLASAELALVATAATYRTALDREMNRRPDAAFEAQSACLEIYLDATRLISRGFHLLSSAIIRADEQRFRHLPFGSWELRYEQRFAHFAALSEPPYVSYDQFTQLTAKIASADPQNLLDAAGNNFLNAKRALDKILKEVDDHALLCLGLHRPTLLGMAKAAVANRVTVAKIKQRLTQDPPVPWTPPPLPEELDVDNGSSVEGNYILELQPRPPGVKKYYSWSNDLDLRFHPHLPVLTHEE